MALIGRAARFVGRRGAALGRRGAQGISSRPGPLIAGAAATGAVMGVAGGDSVYRREIFPDMQETFMGDRNAMNNMVRANIWATFNQNPDEVRRPNDYLYGQPIDPQAMYNQRRAPQAPPVSGQVVWGMYNMRHS